MAEVQTVQGPVDAGELGVVLGHEHVRFRDEAVAEQWPGRYDEQLELDAALVARRGRRRARACRRSSTRPRCSAGATCASCSGWRTQTGGEDRRLHRHLQLRPPPPLLREPRRRRDGRPLRRGHRSGLPGHRDPGRVPEVRRRRRRGDRATSRRSTARWRARACRRARRSWPTRCPPWTPARARSRSSRRREWTSRGCRSPTAGTPMTSTTSRG